MKWLLDRFRYAFAGVRYGIVRDRSIRFQFILAIMAVLAGIILNIHLNEWLWIILSITLVLMAEIFNSCIEKVVDYISTERTEQAKLIKDMAAGAVFLVSCCAFLMACLIYIPRLILSIQNL